MRAPFLRVSLFFVLSLWLNAAQAQTRGRVPDSLSNPFDAFIREKVALAERSAASPAALIPMYGIWGVAEFATPGVATRAFEQLANSRRLSPMGREYARSAYASLSQRDGDAARAQQIRANLGRISAFRVIGSFDNEGKGGFDRELGPETDRLASPNSDAVYAGREREVRWREYPLHSSVGRVGFETVLRPTTNVCAFAESFVQVDRARPLSLWFGAGGASKVYWNGQLVMSDDVYRRSADADRSVVMVDGRVGWNRLLVKECVTDQGFAFYARLGERDGSPAQGLHFAAVTEQALGASGTGRLPAAPAAPLSYFQSRATAANATAEDMEAYARFLRATGADEPAARLAKQFAARAVESAPTIDRYLLAIELAEERTEKMSFFAQLERLAPTDPRTLLAKARLTTQGFVAEDALAILDRLPRGERAWYEGELLRASVLRNMSLPETALSVLNRLAQTVGNSIVVLRARADASEVTQRDDAVVSMRQDILRLANDDLATRRFLIADALERGELDLVRRHLTELEPIVDENPRLLGYLASTYGSLNEFDKAIECYRRAVSIAPDDASLHATLGQALLRRNMMPAAVESLRAALHLRPQDAETRQLLELLEPEARQDEVYATDEAILLERRASSTSYPITVLEDLTVKTVFENGLSSAFHQYAFEVQDIEGARRARTYSFQYDPESQRVEVRRARVIRRNGQRLEANQTFERQTGEPWYRIYYDTRAVVVRFPDLEPGDVVEVRYRVDDVAHRNVFADYFGDMKYWQGGEPAASRQYVLISPKSRTFYFNEPRLAGLTHQRTERGQHVVDRFAATNIPAVVSEEGMPGITEIVPYLHVSTYRTWEDVGRWWWGLIQDQLVIDDAMRARVAQIVRGAPDTATKVARIYDWVVANTRYVGLEFGIHGYLPYRVTQIVERGFGDCKDKASLLYVMLREAGVDARIVLTRTRRNGALNDLPASLSVFDHAIAYVPELDRFLDGTAEFSGSRELPSMDQGVMVLVVGPNDVRLARTPVLPASENVNDRTWNVTLHRDGSANVTGTELVSGDEASVYRKTFEAEGTRRERFEQVVAGMLPGASLQSQSFTTLADRESPVRFEYALTAPSFAQRAGTTLRVAPTVLSDLLRRLARTATRTYPLDIGVTSTFIENRRITLENGLTAQTLPSGGELQSPFGRFKSSFTREGDVIVSRVEFELTTDRVEPAAYAQYRAWVERIDVLLRERIIIEGGAQ